MDVNIQASQVWWEPFLRVARNTSGFKRFCIGKCSDYEKRVQIDLVTHKGRFFYAYYEDNLYPTAVTALSLGDNQLHVHFYWTNNSHPESYPLFSKLFTAVYDHYHEQSFRHVMFPVPSEYLGSWHRYAELHHDAYGRRLNWYKFKRRDFAIFGKLSSRHITEKSLQSDHP